MRTVTSSSLEKRENYALVALRLHLVIGITNPDPSMIREEKSDLSRGSAESNPLTYYERYCMVKAALRAEGFSEDDFSIVPFPVNIPDFYKCYVPMDAVFFITIYDDWGREKKRRFEAMNLKVHVLRDVSESEKGISATDVRKLMASGGDWKGLVPKAVAELADKLNLPERFRNI